MEGQWQAYRYDKMLNEKGVMIWLVMEECAVFTGSLHTVLEVQKFFRLHKCNWIAWDFDSYSKNIVREFNPSYIATLRGSIDKNYSLSPQH